jgi:hypothetical protein
VQAPQGAAAAPAQPATAPAATPAEEQNEAPAAWWEFWKWFD